MFSVVVDGEVQDIRYKRHTEWSYLVYLGDRYIGQVFHNSKGWDLVSVNSLDIGSFDTICGFRTRDDATEMLLRLNKLGGRK
jgi:hypothetical protein